MSIEDIATITIRLKPRICDDAFNAGWGIGLRRGIAEGIRQAMAEMNAMVERGRTVEEVCERLTADAERVDAQVWP